MSNLRTRYTATYLYPGSLFPEEITRTIDEPTLDAALAVAPAEDDGYFRKDGWYALRITATHEKLYTATDGDQEWVRQGQPEKVFSAIVGERIHADDIEDNDRNRILIANIRGNSKDGYGVLTRIGNWQVASDYDYILEPSAVA